MAEFCERFTETAPEDARQSFALVEPYVFTDAGVGHMEARRWKQTMDWISKVHGLPPVDPERVYRPELLGS